MRAKKAWALVRDGQIVSVRLYRREIMTLLDSCRIPLSVLRGPNYEIRRVRVSPLDREEARS